MCIARALLAVEITGLGFLPGQPLPVGLEFDAYRWPPGYELIKICNFNQPQAHAI